MNDKRTYDTMKVLFEEGQLAWWAYGSLVEPCEVLEVEDWYDVITEKGYNGAKLERKDCAKYYWVETLIPARSKFMEMLLAMRFKLFGIAYSPSKICSGRGLEAGEDLFFTRDEAEEQASENIKIYGIGKRI